MNTKRPILLLLTLMLLVAMVSSIVQAQEGDGKFTEEEIANSEYLQALLPRLEETYDTSKFKKDPPYRIALAAQGPTNSWATLFDAHAFWYAEEVLGPEVIEELLYADAQGSADIQVPQVEDLLAQEPDALILVPMGRAALAAPTERAMAEGVPVILCASGVDTDNFVTEVGTNLYESGRDLAQWLVDTLGGEGKIVQMNGIAGVDTAEIMSEGAQTVWAANPGIEVLDLQYGNWSTSEAKQIMEQWIAQYGEEIDGIWSGGAQMSQGIISAYLDAGLEIPPIAGGEYFNGFLRLAKEENITFGGFQYPNAMVVVCIDAAVKTLQGEPVPRFIDFKDEIPGTSGLTSDQIDELYNPAWSDDVFGPILMPEEKLAELGYLVEE